MNGFTACQADSACPEWVVRCWNQNLVTIIEQTLHAHDDQFADAIADDDVFEADVRDLLLLGVLHDGFSCREKPFGVAITLRIWQVVDDVLDNFLRRIKPERFRVADVQLQNPMAFFFHALGGIQHWSAYVVEHVCQFVGFEDFHGTLPPVSELNLSD